MRNEKWKPVRGFESLYAVSDRGRVRSMHKYGRPAKGGILAQQSNRKGYERVCLTGHGRHFTVVVHRLVLDAFVGPQPTPKHETNHKNGRKPDNRVENLEWVTPVENNAHSVANGFWHPHLGEQHGRHKLTAEQVREVLTLEGKERQCDLARRFGVTPTAIGHIWKGRNWKCVSKPS
jgi:hypothetical protein